MTLQDLFEPNIKMNPYMTTTDIRAAIYARVSSTGDRQSTERQVIDLTDYANKNSMTICQTFEEHISGAKKNHERPVLQECLTFCVEEKIDVLLLSELSRLGRNVDEACFEIDKYLDNCYLNGLESVRIVHGKGTGALRAGIHKFLKTHPHVKSFRLGTFGEGEMGVTIVELK